MIAWVIATLGPVTWKTKAAGLRREHGPLDARKDHAGML